MRTLVVDQYGQLSIREVNMPRYGEYQALVKTIACGMCGTDVKVCHHAFKGLPVSEYPVMLGHEGVGEVIATGKKVATFKPGDIVLLPFVRPDRENYPDLGSGWGAMSEYAVVNDPADPDAPDAAFAQKVLDKDIDPVDATMIVTFREVLSGIRYLGIKPEDVVVVIGCGPVGLTYIRLLSLCGVKQLIACDIVPEKLVQAKENGASVVINSREQDVRSIVRGMYPDGVDFALDAAGFPAIVNQCISLIRDRGTVVCYGVPEKEEITVDFSTCSHNWRLVFQQRPNKREEGEAHDQIMQWIRSGELVLKDYISDYFDFDDAVEAYQKLLNRQILKKAIVRFR